MLVHTKMYMHHVSALYIRLTSNWIRGWPGLHHEDWRFQNLRAKTGIFYPLVNLTGIQNRTILREIFEIYHTYDERFANYKQLKLNFKSVDSRTLS